MEKNKPNDPIGPNNTTVPLKERSVPNAVNWELCKMLLVNKEKQIADEETLSADDDKWTPDRRYSIQQTNT